MIHARKGQREAVSMRVGLLVMVVCSLFDCETCFSKVSDKLPISVVHLITEDVSVVVDCTEGLEGD